MKLPRANFFLRRASYLHFILSFLVVEKVWLLQRKKTSKQMKEDAVKTVGQIKGIVENVSSEDLI